MKTFAIGALLALMTWTSAQAADHLVRAYTRSDGTYVAPHYQTNPNSTTSDNYSTRGNTNPYTGQPGYKPDTRPSYGAYAPLAPAPRSPAYANPYAPAPYGQPAKPACSSIYGC